MVLFFSDRLSNSFRFFRFLLWQWPAKLLLERLQSARRKSITFFAARYTESSLRWELAGGPVIEVLHGCSWLNQRAARLSALAMCAGFESRSWKVRLGPRPYNSIWTGEHNRGLSLQQTNCLKLSWSLKALFCIPQCSPLFFFFRDELFLFLFGFERGTARGLGERQRIVWNKDEPNVVADLAETLPWISVTFVRARCYRHRSKFICAESALLSLKIVSCSSISCFLFFLPFRAICRQEAVRDSSKRRHSDGGTHLYDPLLGVSLNLNFILSFKFSSWVFGVMSIWTRKEWDSSEDERFALGALSASIDADEAPRAYCLFPGTNSPIKSTRAFEHSGMRKSTFPSRDCVV